jgi:hypothetical protein
MGNILLVSSFIVAIMGIFTALMVMASKDGDIDG